MRASFLLVLALALVVGLGVAVAVKSLGLLTPVVVTPPTQPPPPPPAPVVVPVRPSFLVPGRPLFAGDTIRPGDVRIRPARPEEMEAYEKNKADYLAAVPEAVYYRFAATDLPADAPMLKSSLKHLSKPDALHSRLVPGMRAVNVSIPKSGSAGGLIQVGDWVDVYITTEVGRTDLQGRTMQTGVLVHHAQVIAKRDTLWSVFAPLPGETSIQYTLAMNTYRSALLEFARSVGTLSMAPVSEAEKQQLDQLKAELLKDPSKIAMISYSDPNSKDYQAEEQRVRDFREGTQSVGSDDLISVLNLKPIPAPVPPPLPPAPRVKAVPPPPITVEVLSGTQKTSTVTFPVPAPEPEPLPPPPAPPTPEQGRYFFVLPRTTAGSKPEPSSGGTAPQVIPPQHYDRGSPHVVGQLGRRLRVFSIT